MPTYYFNVVGQPPDECGVSVRNLAELRDLAIVTAGQMILERRNLDSWQMDVIDADGQLVIKLRFTVEQRGSPANTGS